MHPAEHPRDTTGPETSAFPLRPRFNAACPNSPAADRPTPARNAGTSTMVMCSPARSRSEAETRTTKTRGNGVAASIRVRIRANIRAIPPRPSTRPRRFRARMGSVLTEPDRGRFSGVARSTGMDCREVPPLRSRRAHAAGLEAVARCGGLMKRPQGWKYDSFSDRYRSRLDESLYPM
jgi:hypothetical protein